MSTNKALKNSSAQSLKFAGLCNAIHLFAASLSLNDSVLIIQKKLLHFQKICPTGTYHDPIRDRCRRVPGGGELLKFNLDAKCSNGFTGILPHEKKSRYYFVCKHNAVLTCACKHKEIFDRVRLRCDKKCNGITRERFSHSVVDNIMEKYRCTMMNGHFENGQCWLTPTTTESYSSHQQSSEYFNSVRLN